MYLTRVGCKSREIREESHKKACENDGWVTSSQKDVDHTSLSRSTSPGEEGGRKFLWNLSELLQCTTGHHGAKAKGFQRHCVYVSGVAQHAEDTIGRQGTNHRK